MDRIELLASLAKDANSLVDCGCDHGYTSIKALKSYNVNHCYLLDINDGPLNNAKANVSKENLLDKCDFILSDGLKEFNDDADVLIVAGMGGLLISKILLDDYEKAKKFKKIIIDAHSEIDKLRANLISKYFVFDNEILIQDGKHNYVIIEGHFDPQKRMKYNLLDMKFGPVLRRNQTPLFKEIITKKKEHFKECLKKATDEVSKSKLRIELAYIQMLEGDSDNGKGNAR